MNPHAKSMHTMLYDEDERRMGLGLFNYECEN
jgi:hypothetical protein